MDWRDAFLPYIGYRSDEPALNPVVDLTDNVLIPLAWPYMQQQGFEQIIPAIRAECPSDSE